MIELKATRENIIDKAEELAIEYESRYKGCAPCTFMSTIDALRWAGLELLPEDAENKIFPGIWMLSAGICMTAEGTCGAVIGGTMALGLALGDSRDTADASAMHNGAVTIRNTLLEKCYSDYRSSLCKDIQRKYFGKAWDFTNEEMEREFLGITRGCVIMQIAKLTVGIILDQLEKGNVKARDSG